MPKIVPTSPEIPYSARVDTLEIHGKIGLVEMWVHPDANRKITTSISLDTPQHQLVDDLVRDIAARVPTDQGDSVRCSCAAMCSRYLGVFLHVQGATGAGFGAHGAGDSEDTIILLSDEWGAVMVCLNPQIGEAVDMLLVEPLQLMRGSDTLCRQHPRIFYAKTKSDFSEGISTSPDVKYEGTQLPSEDFLRTNLSTCCSGPAAGKITCIGLRNPAASAWTRELLGGVTSDRSASRRVSANGVVECLRKGRDSRVTKLASPPSSGRKRKRSEVQSEFDIDSFSIPLAQSSTVDGPLQLASQVDAAYPPLERIDMSLPASATKYTGTQRSLPLKLPEILPPSAAKPSQTSDIAGTSITAQDFVSPRLPNGPLQAIDKSSTDAVVRSRARSPHSEFQFTQEEVTALASIPSELLLDYSLRELLRLQDLKKPLPKVIPFLWLIVIDGTSPKPPSGQARDFTSKLTVVDTTLTAGGAPFAASHTGVSLLVFHPRAEDVATTISVGDVLLVQNLSVSMFRQSIQLVASAGSRSRIAAFSGDAVQKYTYGARQEWGLTAADMATAAKVQAAAEKHLRSVAMFSHLSYFQQIDTLLNGGASYADLVVCVAHVHPETRTLFVWDGSGGSNAIPAIPYPDCASASCIQVLSQCGLSTAGLGGDVSWAPSGAIVELVPAFPAWERSIQTIKAGSWLRVRNASVKRFNNGTSMQCRLYANAGSGVLCIPAAERCADVRSVLASYLCRVHERLEGEMSADPTFHKQGAILNTTIARLRTIDQSGVQHPVVDSIVQPKAAVTAVAPGCVAPRPSSFVDLLRSCSDDSQLPLTEGTVVSHWPTFLDESLRVEDAALCFMLQDGHGTLLEVGMFGEDVWSFLRCEEGPGATVGSRWKACLQRLYAPTASFACAVQKYRLIGEDGKETIRFAVRHTRMLEVL